MLLGYNTNGFGFHRLDDVIDILAELGYRALAFTPDVHHLHPFETSSQRLSRIKKRLDELGMACVIESGARFILNPRKKHRPTLLDDDPAPRIDLLRRCMDFAERLGAKVVSTWSGALPVEGDSAGFDRETHMRRLAKQLNALIDEAESRGLTLAIEPEPGFFIEKMSDYDELCSYAERALPLTLDVGHLRCVEEEPEANYIRRYAKQLVNVQLDDMKRGVHRHIPFWEGEVDFPSVFAALREINYEGLACVELSESSRDAVEVARRSMEFLRPFVLESE
ncbi:MAG: sugar phosphate isomerase/epimerase [Planctomycetes bacterium]|nr:sugar phosphate isomerase/epimerase [Planctomycetota bacterium]